MKLYECAQDVANLLDAGIDEETGEMSPELVSALARFQDGGRAVAAYMLNAQAEADACAAAIERIAKRKKSALARVERLRSYLMSQMLATGVTRIDANDGSFSARLYPGRDEAVEIEDGCVLPDRFQRIKVEPDKTRLKAAIKAGEPVPEGVRLVRRARLELR